MRVPPGRQQVVLGLLLLEINRVVPTHRIVDVLWRHEPPETARTQVQICISRLRKLLVSTGATIETVPPGYQLRSDPETVDAQLHSLQVKDAAVLLREGREEEAAELLRATVGLWRGAALGGTDNEDLIADAARLEDERVDATETYLGIELGLGRHTQLVSEISALVEAHPLRENLRAQLMLALYRSGRQAEALEVYRAGRDLLVEELGLEPGRRLRDMESAVLAGDPSLNLPEETGRTASVFAQAPDRPRTEPDPAFESGTATGTHAVTPFQLPTAAADFVGRDDVVSTAERALTGDEGAVGVVALLGQAGVGKSSTAVRIAHGLAEGCFPDGQLYCDMRGSREVPLDPADVLARFLRALGVPGQGIPEDIDERSAIYRGILAGRRVLVVLDDASDETQLLPLIPGSSGCGVIVTSRARLTGLPGATRVELDTLSEEASLELLDRVLGRERVRSQPEAAQALVQAVGRLPLALRIVAARLAARPHWPLAGMVERLSDERHRLDELTHGDMTVRASLSLTHDGLDQRTVRVFSLLGLAEGPTVPAWVAGAVLDDDRPFPSDLAEPLVDAHMLDVVGVDPAGEPVYRFHDLVRDYAREQLGQGEDRQAWAEALERLLGGWLALLDEANHRLSGVDRVHIRGEAPRWYPPRKYVDRLLTDPYVWLEAERANLRYAVAQAAEEGLHELCWELGVALARFLDRRGYVDDLAKVYDTAMPVVRDKGDRLGVAALDTEVGYLLRGRYDPPARQRLMENALSEFVDLGHFHGEMMARSNLAFRRGAEGDLEGAIGYGEHALAGFVSLGDLGRQRQCLLLIGNLRVRTGDSARGWTELKQALNLAERVGDLRGRAQSHWWIGRSHLYSAETEAAVEQLTMALELVRQINDPKGEAALLQSLGEAYLALEQKENGRSALLQSLSLYEDLRDEESQAETRQLLADLL